MKRLQGSILLLAFVLIGILLFSLPASAQYTTLETTCDRAVDGWTLHSPDFGEIRLSGIEPPEGQGKLDLREKARKGLAALAEGKRIRLDFEGPTEDSQGRLLAYIQVGELSLNAWMLKNGYARVSPSLTSSTRQTLFENLQREARENKKGIWAPANVPPAPSAPSVSSPLPQEKKRIIASKKSRYYYRPGQQYYDKVEPKHRVYFDTEQAAQKAGFRPYAGD
jgi:micrococcal nuclease